MSNKTIFAEVYKMKKLLTISLSIVVILGLVGCGAKATGNGTPVVGGADIPVNSGAVDSEKTQDAIQETEEKIIVCEDEAVNPNGTDYGLDMTVRDVTNKGLTLVFTQSGGNPTGELQTGNDYSLEQNVEGYWKPVETVTDEIGWEDIAYIIPKEGMAEIGINWEYLYGELGAGKYRIRKPFMDFRGTGDYDTDSIWREFEIE